MPQLLSVQVGSAQRVSIQGRSVMTAIHKRPVIGPVAVAALGGTGDEQVDLSVHGGLSKAVYAYPSEHYAFWQRARRDATVTPTLPFGSMGENLSLHGLLETEVWVGDVLRFAQCELRVTQPREPCYKFNAAMGFKGASKTMAQSGFCGFYLAVQVPGTVQAGEGFALIAGARALSIADAFRAKMFKHLR